MTWPRVLILWTVLVAVQGASFPEEVMAAISRACQLYMKIEFPSPFNQTLDLALLWNTTDGLIKIPLERASEYIAGSPSFNDRLSTVITIHGFNDQPGSGVPMAISEAYSGKEKYNVMLLDASKIILGNYPKSAYISEFVGKALSNFIQSLEQSTRFDAKNLHLIGISLGAQISGWAGRFYKNATSRTIGRITGLDPAGPCFEGVAHGRRLYKDDARYVDIIHVNQGIQGIIESVGHADYFANGGGPTQPGCSDPNCSHLRAGLLYVDSLYDENSLLGRECQSWVMFMGGKCNLNGLAVVGFHSSERTRGEYYFKTDAAPPFGLGPDGATVNKRISRFATRLKSWFG